MATKPIVDQRRSPPLRAESNAHPVFVTSRILEERRLTKLTRVISTLAAVHEPA